MSEAGCSSDAAAADSDDCSDPGSDWFEEMEERCGELDDVDSSGAAVGGVGCSGGVPPKVTVVCRRLSATAVDAALRAIEIRARAGALAIPESVAMWSPMDDGAARRLALLDSRRVALACCPQGETRPHGGVCNQPWGRRGRLREHRVACGLSSVAADAAGGSRSDFEAVGSRAPGSS